jgi:hypothetical protein
MVTHLRSRSGKSHLGCLFTILVLGVAAFVGKNVGEVYWRYYRIGDYVKEQADFAPALTDDVIRRRLVEFSDTLGLDLGPRDWRIRRTWSPKEITIEAQYEDSIVIQALGMRKVWKKKFQPSAHAPL